MMTSFVARVGVLLVALLAIPATSLAQSLSDAAFAALIRDLDDDDYDIREEASRALADSSLSVAQFKALVGLANAAPSAEVRLRAHNLIADVHIGAFAVSMNSVIETIGVKVGSRLQQTSIPIRIPGAGGGLASVFNSELTFGSAYSESLDNIATPVTATLAEKVSEATKELKKGRFEDARRVLEELEAFLTHNVNDEQWNVLDFFEFDPTTRQALSPPRKVDRQRAIQQVHDAILSIDLMNAEFLLNVPDFIPVEPHKIPVNQAGAVDLGKTLHLLIAGLDHAGSLDLFAGGLDHALTFLPTSMLPVGRLGVFSLTAGDDLDVAGEVTIGVAFGDDVGSLEGLRIGRLAGLNFDLLTPTLDLDQRIAFATYSVSALDANPFGEFTLIQTIPEPSMLALVGIARLVLFSAGRRRQARRVRV